MVGTSLVAQTPSLASAAVMGRIPMQQDRVSISVEDSTIKYIVNTVARQASLQPVYNTSNTLLAKRISAHVRNMEVMPALATILNGTGLTATLAPDHETVVIRPEHEAVDSVSTGIILGRVTDSASKKGIEGVTVLVLGTHLSAMTDKNGMFRITKVPTGKQSISTRLLGYESKVIPVAVGDGQTASVTIALHQMSTTLTEVVTTATGDQKRLEVPNDIARIDPQKIMDRAPIHSLTDLIQAANVPGVQVTPSSGEPGAPARIRIRGIGSISQSNDPVVIVDGVWINAATSTNDIYQKTLRVGSGLVPSRLDDIDPSSIASIEIIRGPSAATLYGQDASNGVIVITTKKGHAGDTRWNMGFSRGWQDAAEKNPEQYVAFGHYGSSTQIQQCNIYAVAAGCTQDSIVKLPVNSPLLNNEGTGLTDRYNISVEGGTQALTYAINGTYQNQIGVRRIPGVDQIRLRQLDLPFGHNFKYPNSLANTSVATRLSASPTQALDLSLNINLSEGDQTQNDYQTTFNFVDPRDTIAELGQTGTVSPQLTSSISSTGLVGLSADWRPADWLRSGIQTGVERTSRRDEALVLPYLCQSGSCLTAAGSRQGYQSQQSVYTARFQASATPSLGWMSQFLSIRPAFGVDFRKNTTHAVGVTGANMTPGSKDLASASYLNGYDTQVQSATAGWYLSATIGLLDRVFFDAGLRHDVGSAITPAGNKTYPKFGVSWVVSQEPFFPKNSFLSTLRLRAALGHSAVQPDVTDINGQYNSGTINVNGQSFQTITLSKIGNTILEPERAVELETGFDAEMFGNRIQLGVTYAHKKNENNLINRTLAPSAGVTAQRKENIAVVVNRDLEVNLSGLVIDEPGTSLTINWGMTKLDNRVARLGNVSPFGQDENRVVQGYPVGGLWERPIVGYSDINHDGLLESNEFVYGDTSVYVGWMQPTFTASYGAALTTFNRRLSFNAQFSYEGNYTQYQTQRNGWLGYWDANAPLSEQAFALIAQNVGNRQTISDLRFQSASVTYHVPEAFLRRFHVRSADISLQGSNLGLWTKYRGRDPAVNSTPTTEQLQDNGLLIPPPRQYSLAFRWGF